MVNGDKNKKRFFSGNMGWIMFWDSKENVRPPQLSSNKDKLTFVHSPKQNCHPDHIGALDT